MTAGKFIRDLDNRMGDEGTIYSSSNSSGRRQIVIETTKPASLRLLEMMTRHYREVQEPFRCKIVMRCPAGFRYTDDNLVECILYENDVAEATLNTQPLQKNVTQLFYILWEFVWQITNEKPPLNIAWTTGPRGADQAALVVEGAESATLQDLADWFSFYINIPIEVKDG
jgi:hypothetical protein